MRHGLVYNLFLFTLIACIWAPGSVCAKKTLGELGSATELAVSKVTKQTTAARPLDDSNLAETSIGVSFPNRKDVPAKRVPLATRDLGLKLVGTVVADNPKMSVAVIANQETQGQRIYREGARFGGKALIKKILRHQVIIDAGRGEEMLTMRHAQPSGRQPTRFQTAGVRLPKTTIKPTRLNSEELEPYFADMDQLKAQVRLYPFEQAEEPAGVLVRNIKRGSIFWRLGLRNRDIIKGVNGKAITSPAAADAFFQDLKKGGEITVEVMRAKRPQ